MDSERWMMLVCTLLRDRYLLWWLCYAMPESPTPPSMPGGKPLHMHFINHSSDIKIKHEDVCIHDKCNRTWGLAHGVGW